MSSLGEWLNAMVELRRNKAQVAEFNAQQQAAGMSALGEGIGGFLGNIGKGMETRRPDILANRLYNQANPPRAQAVNPALQGPADIAAASMPGGPITAGGPFTGGKAGFDMANTLDKSEIAAEKARQAGELGTARIANYASMADARDAAAAYKQSQLELANEREKRLQEKADADRAMDLLTKAPQKYKDDLAAVRHYYADMKVNMAAAAGAKDQYSYDKAVEAITGTYATGEKQGFKVSYPQIPIPAFQQEAGQTLEQEIARKQATYDASWLPNTGLKATIAEKQAQLKALGNYNYQSPGLQPWDLPDEPNLDQYIPPQATQPGPSQAQQQGPAPSAAAPGGGTQTISLDEAKKINPGAVSGKYLQTKQGTFYIQ